MSQVLVPGPRRRGTALSAVQQSLWRGDPRSAPVAAQVAALRLAGRLDEDRLAAAVDEVVDALDVLRAGFAECAGEPVMVADGARASIARAATGGTDHDGVRILRADRDRPTDPLRDPLVRFHLLRGGDAEIVLGLVADPLVLDLRSAYLVLGAVMQAYLGRFRAAQYPALAHAEPAVDAACRTPTPARRAWWTRRLRAWHPGPAVPPAAVVPPPAAVVSPPAAAVPLPAPVVPPAAAVTHPVPVVARQPSTRQLRLDAQRWPRLAAAADSSGNNGWLAVIALLAWWLRARGGRGGAAVFAGTLDLRDYLGLGPVVGPLTDRIAFEVDLDGADRLTFHELVRRAHAGLLDSVVHYVPYRELVEIGAAAGAPPPPLPDRPWDVAVHYCRLPPTSAYTRGEQSLARHGLSVELFCESELAAGLPAAPVDVHLTESGSGVALVVNFDAAIVADADVAAMLRCVDELIDQLIADPDTRPTTL